jgi:hypothetical protein
MSVMCAAIGERGTPFASLPYPVMVMHNHLGVLPRHGLEYFGNRKGPRESTDGAAHISRSGQGAPRSRTIGSAADPCWLSGLAAWLADPATRSFSFRGSSGTFTVLEERCSGRDGYWTAYRKRGGKLRNVCLGKPPLASFVVPEGSIVDSLLNFLIQVVILMLTFSLAEEIGIRGYLLPKLLSLGRTRALASRSWI